MTFRFTGVEQDGNRLWRVEMPPPQPDASLDPASSPVIADDAVIVQNDWRQGGFAAAYDITTGRERRRIERSEGLACRRQESGKPARPLR